MKTMKFHMMELHLDQSYRSSLSSFLAQTTIDENKYGFRVNKNPNGYDWGK